MGQDLKLSGEGCRGLESNPILSITSLFGSSWCPIYSRPVETLSMPDSPYNPGSDYTQGGLTVQLCRVPRLRRRVAEVIIVCWNTSP
jgi:hypothetical protein